MNHPGCSPKGGIVRLWPNGNAIPSTLALGEGVESTLSGPHGFLRAAALSASNLGNLSLPPAIQRLAIYADNDHPGLKAAGELGLRAKQAGIRLAVLKPPDEGDDWNHVLQREGVP
jgi:hypothetical protein